MEVVFGSDASARPERFQLNWLEHFHTFRRGSNLNWIGRFSASRGLQLINILHIPNTPFFLFRAGLCDARHYAGSSELSMGDGWTATGVLIKA